MRFLVMAEDRYLVMTVQCSRCKTKQKVHVNARTGLAQMSNQMVLCLLCNNPFKMMLPDKIIRGPFPA